MKCLLLIAVIAILNFFLTMHLVEKGVEYGRAYAMEEQVLWRYAIHNECEVMR